MAGAFLLSGTVHLVRPSVFASLIPSFLGPPVPWVLASGVAELAGGAGLLTRQRWAPAFTTATLAVIWVGNWQMALDLQSDPQSTDLARALGWARLPLQIPLIVWAWRSPTRDASAPPEA